MTLWNKVRPQRADTQRANRRRAPRQRAGAPSVMAGLEPLEHRLALAAVLDVTPLTWDIVGLDSNKPVTSGPDTFLVAARIANTGDQAISGVQATLNLGDTVRLNADDQWATIADDYITTVGPTTLDSTFTIAPGEFVDAYFSIRIDRTSDAFTTARRYDITATDGVISDSLDATHQLYVEQLVSQNRNATSLIEVLSGGTPVSAAMPGDLLTIVHRAQSAPGGYEQTTNALTIPTNVFEIISTSARTVETTFSADTSTRVTSPESGVYLNAAGWHSDPGVLALDPAYNTTTDNQKAGGVMETTYQVRVRPAAPVGAVTLTGVIYDFSGSSFHYNADSGVVFKTLQITGGTGVSGRVWRDVNANNRQDSSEPGVLGVVVELRDAATGVVVATKVTNQNGDYLFSESDGVTLNTSYVVHVVQPAGTAFVRQDAPGSNDTNDSDVSQTTGQTAPFTLTSGSPLLENLDAGLSFAPAEISGYTWSDINGDGLQDATEVAIDAFVQLFQVVDGQASRVATFETVASGRDAGLYSFTGLAPGDYFVRIVPSDPALALTNVDVGSDDLLDSDVDPFTNDSAVFQVAVGETHAVDAGVVSAAVVMGTVWNDDDVDGLFEGEAGVRGVTVELLDANGGVLQSTVTGTDGSYLFESVPPSIGAGYAIRVVPATGYGIAPADVGGDDAVDSDVSVASGETVLFAVAPGSTTVLDAGIYLAPPDAVDDDRTTPVDTPIDIAMLGNDVFARLKTIAFTQPVDPDCSVTLDDNGTPLDPTDDSFVFTPVNGFTGVSTFTYTLTNSEGEADTAVVTVTVGTAAATVADLSITKTDGQATAIPGTAITYTIVVGNSGPADVVGATIDDAIPAVISGVTWTASYSAGSGGAASGVGSLVAEPIDLLTGGSATFVVTGMLAADATGTLVNTATVTPPTGFTDGDLTNNSATDSTSLVPTVNLRVTKDDGVTTVSAGGTADYTIIVTNDGPSVVTGAVVSDVLPAGLSYVSATNGATYDAGTRTVSYTSGLLTPTATESFVVSVAVAATFPAGQGSITNTATVAAPAGVTESDATDNADSDTNTLDAAPDLTLTKSSAVTSVSAGESVTYVLAYANVGTQDATGVEISDTLPTGMSFDPAANAGWTLSGSTLTYTVGNLAAGASGSV
ncbi:MAG: DUF11 domain-containing protein, partial [Pirellulales bacterium]|nr:DUF11 domain-containing protein [Pirellulales bacterium]